MSKKIRVAIAGVGSCASALVQGVQYYINHPDETIGLMFKEIGGYTADSYEFVCGFDVDARKVGKRLNDAIYAKPNCNMQVIPPHSDLSCVASTATVYRSPTLDGIAPHMRNFHPDITFVEADDVEPITAEDYQAILKEHRVDVLLNYMPVGSTEAAKFHIENAIKAGVHVVNCMPTYISTEAARGLERLAIQNKVTIVGSDMRSDYGASRLSEVLQGSLLDSGLLVTQHIQENKAAGTTQGDTRRVGRSANTDFLNMAVKDRLHDKHISKENVLTGQSVVRGIDVAGTTQYAGPSLTVLQRPGGQYVGSDNKIANIDIVAFGWAGARYELFARLSVQDSPNSAGIVFDAVRFCKVASEMDIRGYLRGPSAWSQKTPPVQMKTSDSKFECEALARRELTNMTRKQVGDNIDIDALEYTFQAGKTAYE
ncbi:Myo-inositol-1-phosphate synthase [Ralstonia phage RP13]|nr:Myo-inositol-1-phosphate synthase [Ralstonia phage RP13]